MRETSMSFDHLQSSAIVCNKVEAKVSGSKDQTVFLQIRFGLCVVIAVERRGNLGRRGRFGRWRDTSQQTCGIASLWLRYPHERN